MHRQRWISVLALSSVISWLPLAAAQDAASGNATSARAQAGGVESSSAHKSKPSHANDLLIRGTVFNEHALALQGAKLRVRRSSEKKSRWQTYSNFRGEYAIRVPQGSDYEVEVESKGYAKQSQAIHGQAGEGEQKAIFHMEPAKGGK
ncbi:MAG TPA: carboxypeptidase-like regulatory domain-containing protein [Candidatus Acidoferrum sp.]